MRYGVVFEGFVAMREEGRNRAPTAEELEVVVDGVVEALNDLGAEDVSVATRGSDASIEISISTNASSAMQAIEAGHGFIRGAIQATGGATPGWQFDWLHIAGDRTPEEPTESHTGGEEELSPV